MFFGEQPVKLRALVFLEQSEVDALQNVGFVGNGWKSHLTNFRQEFSKVQSFVVPPCPAAILPFQMKQPCGLTLNLEAEKIGMDNFRERGKVPRIL
jgi:hypothetical protein